MLGTEQVDLSEDKWSKLKGHATHLLDKLESGDLEGISNAINELADTRDKNLYLEVGKLTRGLHDAIANFDLDTDLDNSGADQASKIINAQDRLDYIIRLTQSSANKTIDKVEEGIPIASELGAKANALRDEWERIAQIEMNSSEFNDLHGRIGDFLNFSSTGSSELCGKLNEILLAQDFQDLTGQVIKKVSTLVQEVESRLVLLMKTASQIEELAGIVSATDPQAVTDKASGRDLAGEGPQINAEQHDNVVAGQDEVDDLLSSLGF